MLKSDKERFQESLKRIDLPPLGASALAGTTFPIDRHYTAEPLGFSNVYEKSYRRCVYSIAAAGAARRRNSYGGTGFDQVKVQLGHARKLI